ncbi:ComF family protein [Kushneria phosphatilytica]|uniref:ComF family protein n=1 Tax=Kushneria phosphatilytica TaxID=657387 RepID=A0A5C1A558_9GAMM|nr:ComF family protein [Kushneria phosphatilytica]
MPGYCAFCLGPAAAGKPWCRACYAGLPHHRHACLQCGDVLKVNESRRCGRCLKSPPPFEATHVPWRYEGDIAATMQRFKFQADRRAGHLLAALMDEGLDSLSFAAPVGVLMPVPLHVSRARERGFDQTAWLARQLAARRGWQLLEAQRLRATPSQRDLDRRARRRNVAGAFRVPYALPETVILFDDVMTTGATFASLAQACRDAGASKISVLAVARTPSRDHRIC